jgi:broad specificity phosphatase PhoE
MTRVFVGLTVVLAVASQALAQPSQVILIRHAEKPMSGNELSPQGRERAAALVPFFLGTDELLEFNTPAAIYAQSQKKETSSIRSIETVKPLAEALQLRINKTSARDEFQAVGQRDRGQRRQRARHWADLLGAKRQYRDRQGVQRRRDADEMARHNA